MRKKIIFDKINALVPSYSAFCWYFKKQHIILSLILVERTHKYKYGIVFIWVQPIIIITKNTKPPNLSELRPIEFWPRFWPKYFFKLSLTASEYQFRSIVLPYTKPSLHVYATVYAQYLYINNFFVRVTPSIEYSDYCVLFIRVVAVR